MSYDVTLIQQWALGLVTYVRHNEISLCRGSVFSICFTTTPGARKCASLYRRLLYIKVR